MPPKKTKSSASSTKQATSSDAGRAQKQQGTALTTANGNGRKTVEKPIETPTLAVEAWAKELDQRETAFVRQYLVDFNATQACLRANLTTDTKTAGQMGWEFRQKPHVVNAIDKALETNSAGPRQWLLGQFREFSQASIDSFFDWLDDEGRIVLKKGSDVPKEMRRFIKKVRILKDGDVVIELHDQMRALELIAKVAGLERTKKADDEGDALEKLIYAALALKAAKEA